MDLFDFDDWFERGHQRGHPHDHESHDGAPQPACQACGAKVPTGAAFCHGCGLKP